MNDLREWGVGLDESCMNIACSRPARHMGEHRFAEEKIMGRQGNVHRSREVYDAAVRALRDKQADPIATFSDADLDRMVDILSLIIGTMTRDNGTLAGQRMTEHGASVLTVRTRCQPAEPKSHTFCGPIALEVLDEKSERHPH